MDRKQQLLVISLLFVGWAFGGAIPDKFLSVSRTSAREADRATVQRWEYCALSKAAYVGSARGGIYWISYFRESGVQVVEVEASATDTNGAALSKAISRLGSEGWEMVAPGLLDINQGQVNAIYFKRPKASS